MLYNICYVIIYNICHVMLYNISHVILFALGGKYNVLCHVIPYVMSCYITYVKNMSCHVI